MRLPLAMLNRHGLIAGATGTGKTKTLQLIAEQLPPPGVPVFAADVKGDVSGLAAPAEAGGPAEKRMTELGLPFEPAGFPVEFLSLGGIGPGVPVRATVSDFGPAAAGEGAGRQRDAGAEPRARLPLRRREGPAAAGPRRPARAAHLPGLGRRQGRARGHRRAWRAPPSACSCARSSGSRPAAATSSSASRSSTSPTSCARPPTAAASISCLELPAVQDKPKLFSTALMWLLAELFEQLPEAGDLDKPKLVFFFDEAHLLFDDATDAFLDSVDADRAPDPLQGRRRLLRHPGARTTSRPRCSASSATASSTRCARSRPTTRRR